MDFSFSDEQERLRARVRTFAAGRLAPHYQAGDRERRMRPELPREMAAEGLLGLRVPVEHGGAGADCVTTGVAMEEVARADLNAGYLLLLAALIADILLASGTEEQRRRWLPSIAAGTDVPALCLTEPEHGSDAAAVELRAEAAAGGWRLTGTKTSVMLGMQATHGLVFARTGEPGARGVTAFYVPLDGAHVSRLPLRDLGNRSMGRARLELAGLPAGREHVVGGEGLGFVQVMRGFEYSRALISLMCVATAQAAVDDALEHARTRHAFGQPIGRFQGLSFPLVEHATYLRAARLLAYEALWLKDSGRPHTVPANMAKWWAPRAAADAAHQALLAFGHHGWSEESPQGQRMRDIMGLEIGDGTAQIAKLVVARALLGRDAAP
ncbi:MAG TPA: acyl-CoA dehydrogenase family protein [Candidatus Eisenbacteria bacterium]|nr:acyl-CoA dehydrogenase family protein [Candidatus Eisenbacteria bacterium]